jgi:KEOPS complex subunit Cgi121
MMVEGPKNLNIIGLKGKAESSEKFIKSARDLLGNGDSMFQFFDADFILGEEHILVAYEHAMRAFETKKNISKSMAMEILVYVSGEPQIANALKKVGVKDGCERMVLVAHEDLDVKTLISHLNLKKADDVLKCTKAKLENFGIGGLEISAVDKDKIKDLILERVAMVDVRK